jgi:transcriptional regulator with XRE-family HTH domain
VANPPEPKAEVVTSGQRLIRRSWKITFGPDQDEASDVLRAFGRHLTLLRAEASLPQQKLADRCFMSHSQVSSFERGVRVPNLLALLLLAHGLDVSIESLTEGLIAPARWASVAQMLELLARRPGISTDAAAESLQLPPWYVAELVLYLQSVEAIVRDGKGPRSGLRLASREPPDR